MAQFEHTEEMVVGLYDRSMGTSVASHKIFDIGTSKILKSGIWSPYLVNMRPALSFDHENEMPIDEQEKLRSQVLGSVCLQLDEINSIRPFDHIYGEPEAGTPFTAAIAAIGGYSLLWRRVVPKPGYGTHELLEGVNYEGEIVAQVDDVVTLAETKREADEFLTECGAETYDVAVFGDREQGGKQKLHDMGLELKASVGMLTAFEVLRAHHRITQNQFDFLHDYTTGPLIYEEPLDHPWKSKS